MNAFPTAILAVALTSATAASALSPSISIAEARIRPAPVGAPTAAGYVTLTNNTAKPDRLIGAATPAAASVELHAMSVTGGIMRMRPLPSGVTLPPRQTVRLAPGGIHLMLISPTRPLRAGDRVAVALKFRNAGTVRATFAVGDTAPGRPS